MKKMAWCCVVMRQAEPALASSVQVLGACSTLVSSENISPHNAGSTPTVRFFPYATYDKVKPCRTKNAFMLAAHSDLTTTRLATNGTATAAPE